MSNKKEKMDMSNMSLFADILTKKDKFANSSTAAQNAIIKDITFRWAHAGYEWTDHYKFVENCETVLAHRFGASLDMWEAWGRILDSLSYGSYRS